MMGFRHLNETRQFDPIRGIYALVQVKLNRIAVLVDEKWLEESPSPRHWLDLAKTRVSRECHATFLVSSPFINHDRDHDRYVWHLQDETGRGTQAVEKRPSIRECLYKINCPMLSTRSGILCATY